MKINQSFGVKKVDDPRWNNYVEWLKGLENTKATTFNHEPSRYNVFGIHREGFISNYLHLSPFDQILTLDEVEAKFGVSFADKPKEITREQAEKIILEYLNYHETKRQGSNKSGWYVRGFLDHKYGNRDELLKRKAEIEAELKDINEKLK